MSADRLVDICTDLGLDGFSAPEVRFMHETMAQIRPDIVLEWGTNVGNSARIFHESKQLLGLNTEIHSFDVVDEVPLFRAHDKKRFRGYHVRNLPVRLHVARCPENAINVFRDSRRKRPLFFLDDNHEFESVYVSLHWIAGLVPKAAILVHDACLNRDQEPDRAIRAFLTGDDYEASEVVSGQCMVRLVPK